MVLLLTWIPQIKVVIFSVYLKHYNPYVRNLELAHQFGPNLSYTNIVFE